MWRKRDGVILEWTEPCYNPWLNKYTLKSFFELKHSNYLPHCACQPSKGQLQLLCSSKVNGMACNCHVKTFSPGDPDYSHPASQTYICGLLWKTNKHRCFIIVETPILPDYSIFIAFSGAQSSHGPAFSGKLMTGRTTSFTEIRHQKTAKITSSVVQWIQIVCC